ncbi:MAG: replication initiator protein [Microviridae sp.]|nr:MAG: replication initiator protein [Microviridae sp.]
MKRLRFKFRDRKIGFFACGEYGGQFERPHYHVLLFGMWFRDCVPFKKSVAGFQLYRSADLDSLWTLGHADIGQLSFESAAYAARYVVDKINGDPAAAHYAGRHPEFVRMSLRPAIGRRWFERFSNDVYPDDFVVVRGRKGRTPLYYDKLLAEREAALLEEAKKARADSAIDLKSLRNRTPKRLAVREEVVRSRLNLYKK